MKHSIVIGAGYGDEGKGLMTAYLASKAENPMVIRFNGGPQAGHTVVSEDKKHVFSSFGSGTLEGHPSYFSEYTCLDPMGWLNEQKALVDRGITPEVYIDPLCKIITPYDVAWNQQLASQTGHGSCGMGVGSTFERNLGPVKLHMIDLLTPGNFLWKLSQIKQYYINKGIRFEILEKVDLIIPGYIEAVQVFNEQTIQAQFKDIVQHGNEEGKTYDLIFEGAQGLWLDQDHGLFPHVTRSYTTSRNAMELYRQSGYKMEDLTICYVSRCYATRHGHGPLSVERPFEKMNLKPFEGETNKVNTWQGALRYGVLDLEMLVQGLAIDTLYCGTTTRKTLTLTCLDQMHDPRRIPVALSNGERVINMKLEQFKDIGGGIFDDLYVSFSPEHSKICPISELQIPEEQQEAMEEMKF